MISLIFTLYIIYGECNTRKMLQDWIIILTAKKLIWCLSDLLFHGCSKGIFPIHLDIKSKTIFSHIYIFIFILIYNIILPRHILPVCLGFAVWEMKMRKYKKQLIPWLKHNSGSLSIDFFLLLRLIGDWHFVPEFIIFIFSLTQKNPS